jgi:hypothetical protein
MDTAPLRSHNQLHPAPWLEIEWIPRAKSHHDLRMERKKIVWVYNFHPQLHLSAQLSVCSLWCLGYSPLSSIRVHAAKFSFASVQPR